MPISPLYVGERHKPLSVTWVDDSSTAVDLTGATLSVRFSGVGSSSSFTGSGSFSITSPSGGLFTYTLSATDVATAGSWVLQFVATYGDATKTYSDPVPLVILADL